MKTNSSQGGKLNWVGGESNHRKGKALLGGKRSDLKTSYKIDL